MIHGVEVLSSLGYRGDWTQAWGGEGMSDSQGHQCGHASAKRLEVTPGVRRRFINMRKALGRHISLDCEHRRVRKAQKVRRSGQGPQRDPRSQGDGSEGAVLSTTQS